MLGTSDPAEYLLILSTKYFSVVDVPVIYSLIKYTAKKMSWGKAVCSAVISIFHISPLGLQDSEITTVCSDNTLSGILSYMEICDEMEENHQNYACNPGECLPVMIRVWLTLAKKANPWGVMSQ